MIPPASSYSAQQPLGLVTRFSRKLLLLLVGTTLLFLPVILIGRLDTTNPFRHSKEIAARWLVGAMGMVVSLVWPLLRRARMTLIEYAIVFLLGAQLAASLFSEKLGYCVSESWHLWGFIGLVLLVPRLAPTAAELRTLLAAALLAGMLCLAYGFLKYFGHDPFSKIYPVQVDALDGRVAEGRAYMHSFLGNPEYFGGYVSPLAVLMVSGALRRGATRFVIAMCIGAGLLFLLGLALTGTRGAMLGFTIGSGAVAWAQLRHLSQRFRRRMFLAAGLGALGAALGILILSTPNPLNTRNMRMAQRFTQVFDLTSLSVKERLVWFILSTRIIAENPVFGSGPSTYRLEFFPALDRLVLEDPRAGVSIFARDIDGRIAEHAHCDYLEVWADSGTLGIAGLFLVIAALAARFARGMPKRVPQMTEAVAHLIALRSGFFGAALCVFTNALFSFPLQLPVRASLVWISVGCFLAADNRLRRGIS